MDKLCLLSLLVLLSYLLLILILALIFTNYCMSLLFLKICQVSVNLLKTFQSFFEFHPNVCLVKSQGSNEILLKGRLSSDGLYTFPSLLSSPSSKVKTNSLRTSSILPHAIVNSASVHSITANTWHSRFGHPSAAVQKLVMQLCKIPFINKSELDFCCSCCLGKAHRLHSFYHYL